MLLLDIGKRNWGGHERNQFCWSYSLFCMFYACECLSNCDCREVDVVYCCEYVCRHDGDFVLRIESCLFCMLHRKIVIVHLTRDLERDLINLMQLD
jgi:hypothetical protein